MPALFLVAGLIVMFLVISLLNYYSKNEEQKDIEDLNIEEHNVSSCKSCGHTGACQHKIF